MSCGSGIKFVNYSLVIEISLQKLRLGPRAITTLICQALLTCWSNGMEVSSGHGGGQRVQELDVLLPKGPLMKSSGFTKPQPRLTLLFVFLQKPRWRQKALVFL